MTTGKVLVAVEDGPGVRRRGFIAQDPPSVDPAHTRGWSFIVEEIASNGEVQPLWDTWEESFEEIVRYPPQWLNDQVQWRDKATGQSIDLMSLTHPSAEPPAARNS